MPTWKSLGHNAIVVYLLHSMFLEVEILVVAQILQLCLGRLVLVICHKGAHNFRVLVNLMPVQRHYFLLLQTRVLTFTA